MLCHIIAALWTAPDGMAASALHALVCLGIGNGCLWLAICSWRCPLPFRWEQHAHQAEVGSGITLRQQHGLPM